MFMFIHPQLTATQKQHKKLVTWTYEYDLEIQQGSTGCRVTWSCKISSS